MHTVVCTAQDDANSFANWLELNHEDREAVQKKVEEVVKNKDNSCLYGFFNLVAIEEAYRAGNTVVIKVIAAMMNPIQTTPTEAYGIFRNVKVVKPETI